MVYVSEVSHRYDGRLVVFGGGFYPRGRIRAAVVARRPDAALDSRAYVGVVAGLQGGSPSVLGLFDHLGNPLDRTTLLPLGPEEALDQVQRAAAAACPVVDSAVE